MKKLLASLLLLAGVLTAPIAAQQQNLGVPGCGMMAPNGGPLAPGGLGDTMGSCAPMVAFTSSILPPSLLLNPPDVYINFKSGQGWVKSTNQTVPASSLVNVSRSSPATQVDAGGNWSQVGSNMLAASGLGASIWEGRTNSIRNNTMQGAVVMADDVELTTNGNFAAQGSGWTVSTAGGGSVVFSTGQVQITGDNATNTNYIARQISGLTPGRSYVIKITGPNGFNILVGTSAGDNSILGPVGIAGNGIGSNQSDRTAFSAPQSGTVWLSVVRFQNATGTLTSVSVQDGERVENGAFTSNPINAAQSTVQNGWQWSISAGTSTATYTGGNSVTLTSDASNDAARIDTSFPTVSGFTYTLTLDATTGGSNILVGTTQGGAGLLSVASGVGTGLKFQFTATSATTWLRIQRAATGSSVIANVSVQSAGALPTNWVGQNLPELQATIVGVGVQNGVNYIDYRVVGTPASTSQRLFIQFEQSGVATSSYGQTWSQSAFFALVGGSLTNIGSLQSQYSEATGGLQYGSVILNAVITSTLARYSNSATALTAANTSLVPRVLFGLTSGQPIDATIRIGWPQLENNSQINSTVASATSAASGTGGVNGTAVYQVGGGTGTAATLNCTWAAGVLTVNSVASAGSYTTFPPSPAALTYVSGTATGWTGSTVTLTPTSNASQAAASPPILTSGAAATRNVEVDTLNLAGLPSFGSAYTTWVRWTPQLPLVAYAQQNAFQLDDGTNSQRSVMRRGQANGGYLAAGVGGSGFNNNSVGTFAPNVSTKWALAEAAGTQNEASDGTLGPSSSAALLPNTPTNARIGVSVGTESANGNIEEMAIWFSQALSGAQLQALTQ